MAFSVRSVLVTGASRGLGLEFVRQIVALPCAPEIVVATCRNPSSASELQELAKAKASVKIIQLDVENDDDIDRAFKETQALVGDRGLNILINNAGYYEQINEGELPHVTRDSMQKHFSINVSSPLLLVQKFLPLLEIAVANRGSKRLDCQAEIVMLVSIMGSQTLTYRDGVRTCFHYKCSKSAATMASIMLARELGPAGIHVLPLHPGWVKTDMGGSDAPVSQAKSIAGCLKVIGAVSQETTGKVLDYQGNPLPF